jgi:MYXO-CTERM domain-containing protein
MHRSALVIAAIAACGSASSAWASGAPLGPARVELPAGPGEPARVVDRQSGMLVEFSNPVLAESTPVGATGDLVLYDGPRGSAFVRFGPAGLEDWVEVMEGAHIDYQVHLGPGVAGLRLSPQMIEFVDAGGAPRLRMRAPLVMDAAGLAAPIAVTLTDCSADTSPAPPWGRPPVAPGATRCTVRLHWEAEGLAYPVLVDPAWETTGDLTVARTDHAATLLADGKVLVAGGYSTSQNVTAAEIYDPPTGTWATTGSMVEARTKHDMGRVSTGKVVAVGGVVGGGKIMAELYDPATGTWSAAADGLGGYNPAVVALDGGKVLACGGLGGDTASWLFDPAQETWLSTGDMTFGRRDHALVMRGDGKAMAIGGSDGSGPVSTVELYDAITGQWTPTGSMSAERTGPFATALKGDAVLVVGGYDGNKTLSSSEVYDPSSETWSAGPSLASAPYSAVIGALQSGFALLVAGNEALGFVPGSTSWVAAGQTNAFHNGGTATLLESGKLLLAGGGYGVAAELFSPVPDGTPCTGPLECLSGACADGVCCDTACDGDCDACTAELKGSGPDGSCGPMPVGTSCGETECSTGSVRSYACDAVGTCEQSEVSCEPYQCADATTCATSCGSDQDCVPETTCDLAADKCTAGICKDDVTLEKPDGELQSCAPYRCDDGFCKTTCEAADDCAPNPACADVECVAGECQGVNCQEPAAVDEGGGESEGDGCGCRVAERRGSPSALALLLLALVLAARRK